MRRKFLKLLVSRLGWQFKSNDFGQVPGCNISSLARLLKLFAACFRIWEMGLTVARNYQHLLG